MITGLRGAWRTITPNRASTRPASDPWLVLSLLLATAFCVHGMEWGRYESWHPDQLVYFRFNNTDSFLQPGGFQKPPFYSYMNYFLVTFPLKVARYILDLPPSFYRPAVLIMSRMLTLGLFLGCIVFVYAILRPAFGSLPARISCLLLATSSGFITYAHFLTTDIPVTFWVLAALLAAARILRSGSLGAYVAAGLCTGLAAATKYNGLGIGIAFATAHFLVWRQSGAPIREVLLARRFLSALGCVVLGFVLGNPYALLIPREFLVDFSIVYTVTPIYSGVSHGNSYLEFLLSAAEIFGVPLSVLLGIAIAYAIGWLIRARPWASQQHLVLIALVTLAVYYAKMGAFPRWETRFAVPILPLILLLAAPFWQRLGARPALALTVPLMAYGSISSAYVGRALLDDPRMDSQLWFAEHVPEDAHVEISAFSAFYHRIPGVQIERVWMPWISTRRRLLPDLFADQPALRERWHQIEPPENVSWYSAAELDERRPDLIALNSIYYHRFTSAPGLDLYPEIAAFFRDLLCERLGYEIVFDQQSAPLPWWFYPRRIDFLENRMIILARVPAAAEPSHVPEPEACDLAQFQGYYAFHTSPDLPREEAARNVAAAATPLTWWNKASALPGVRSARTTPASSGPRRPAARRCGLALTRARRESHPSSQVGRVSRALSPKPQ